MALTQIATPYPIFTDTDGKPLDDGYLYFGEVSKNPETNPIQVYWDSALTQPAAQPIRTSNGYPWRNGSPSQLYGSGNFSLTVRNKKKELVIYSPYGNGSFSLGQDYFTGDGSTVLFSTSFTSAQSTKTDVHVDGVYQYKNTYTFIGNSLTFSEAPPSGSKIEINYG